MLKSRRLFGAASALPLLLAGFGGTAAAQDTNTVGNPQLKGYSLPGERTVPAQPIAPPPTAQAPAPAPRSERPRPAPPSRRAADARPAPARLVPEAAPPRVAPQPAPVQPAPARAQPPPAQPTPRSAPAAPAPAAPAEQPSGRPLWLWLVAALVLAAAAAAFFLLRRRRGGTAEVRERDALAGSLAAARWREPEAEPAPPAQAVPEPVPVPEPEPQAKRALLDVDINPDRASALEDGALVHYTLLLTNNGEATAGNIRIDGRMFNASADGELDGFFRAPLHEVSGSPHVFIAPGETIVIEGQIGMKRDELQPIEVQGRVIFVPIVAVNVAYDWEGGSGRTSKSWLVGRQASAPTARMGAFRLDLGPRIYRQVERREAKTLVA
jgi:hypothetical protein